jgi:hypothetical protein
MHLTGAAVSGNVSVGPDYSAYRFDARDTPRRGACLGRFLIPAPRSPDTSRPAREVQNAKAH